MFSGKNFLFWWYRTTLYRYWTHMIFCWYHRIQVLNRVSVLVLPHRTGTNLLFWWYHTVLDNFAVLVVAHCILLPWCAGGTTIGTYRTYRNNFATRYLTMLLFWCYQTVFNNVALLVIAIAHLFLSFRCSGVNIMYYGTRNKSSFTVYPYMLILPRFLVIDLIILPSVGRWFPWFC